MNFFMQVAKLQYVTTKSKPFTNTWKKSEAEEGLRIVMKDVKLYNQDFVWQLDSDL